MTVDEKKRTADHWSVESARIAEEDRGLSWLEIPQVKRYVNRLVSDDESRDWIDHSLTAHLAGKTPLGRCLSLGCGEGRIERRLAASNAFLACDAYDVAPGSIDLARRLAHERGYDHIHYEARDVNAIELPPGAYDAVWIEAAMHHFTNLEHVSAEIARALKPGGLLLMYEYVGAKRFQFSARQKELITASLTIIPERFRRTTPEFSSAEAALPTTRGARWLVSRAGDKLRDGTLIATARRRASAILGAQRAGGADVIRKEINFPTERDVIASDPSESVRSDEIEEVLPHYLDIVERRGMGGGLLHFALGGIANNFRDDDAQSVQILAALIDLEQALVAAGDLKHDFAFFAARPKGQ